MRKILRVVANLKFAISLLVIISLTITIGSVIEQDQTLEYYKENYPKIKPLFGFLTWEFINYTGIDHLYRTNWFIGLLLIFGTSLLSCTFLQQFPTLKFSRRCNFFVKKKLPCRGPTPSGSRNPLFACHLKVRAIVADRYISGRVR